MDAGVPYYFTKPRLDEHVDLTVSPRMDFSENGSVCEVLTEFTPSILKMVENHGPPFIRESVSAFPYFRITVDVSLKVKPGGDGVFAVSSKHFPDGWEDGDDLVTPSAHAREFSSLLLLHMLYNVITTGNLGSFSVYPFTQL